MAKKRSTELVYGGYPALAASRWTAAQVADVSRPDDKIVRFELSFPDDPLQDGRVLVHELPAVLAPGTSLEQWLVDAFAVQLHRGQPFDLADLVGQTVMIKVNKPGPDGDQTIVKVKAAETNSASSRPVNGPEPKEV